MVDSTQSGSPEGMREVPVDWEALEDAFENNAPEVHSYLHLSTGEVLRVVDGIADPDMHARIASDASYMRIEPVSSREQYRWMERFIPMLEDGELQERLAQAIDGKGAFRRFKDVLMSYAAERERWFAFRSERLRVFMEAWLAAHGLQAVARPAVPAATAPTPEESTGPSIPPEALGARRGGRTSELQRKQLFEIAEALSSRDLEKVLAFAEFLKARRSARAYASRSEAPPPPGPDASPDDEGDGARPATPSSARRTSTIGG